MYKTALYTMPNQTHGLPEGVRVGQQHGAVPVLDAEVLQPGEGWGGGQKGWLVGKDLASKAMCKTPASCHTSTLQPYLPRQAAPDPGLT